MSRGNLTYPFSAVMGEITAKRALMCLLADDRLNGVLIKGPSATAKSVLVRSMTALTDRSIVDLPAGTGDEDIFGGIDFERAVKDGSSVMKGGILSRADGNILCIDNINLLDPRTLNSIMGSLSSGTVKIEREGISAEYPCSASVVATMDPLERDLPESVADRFDICVSMTVETDAVKRGDVVASVLDFDRDPESFARRFVGDDAEVRHKIECARSLIPSIKVTRRDIQDIVTICTKMNAVGHRGDLACARVARALCALDGRDRITADDIRDASVMCLLHRRKPKLKSKTKGDASVTSDDVPDAEISDDDMDISNTEIAKLTKMSADEGLDVQKEIERVEAMQPETSADMTQTQQDDPDPDTSDTDDAAIPDVDVLTMVLDEVRNDLAEIDRIESIRLNSVVGHIPRGVNSSNRNGRASGFRIPEGRTSDPALGATIRAAAPYQKTRRSNGLSITIVPDDIRENIRTKQSSCSFLFAVDVSGSLVNTGALDEAIKGVRAMLEDGYVRRDRVALLTFGQNIINLAVPFTRNVENVFESLRRTVTGGSTPLGEALLTINKYMTNYVRKNPDEKCFIILITDAEADRPVVEGYEPWAELKRIAAIMKIPNTEWILIDNGKKYRRINYAKRLADILSARYLVLDDLTGRFDEKE